MPDETKSVSDGALKCQKADGDMIFTRYGWKELKAVAKRKKFSLSTPWKDLSEEAKHAVLYGIEGDSSLLGVIPVMNEVWEQWHIAHFRRFMLDEVCPECLGSRLHPAARSVRFHGYGIHEISEWSIDRSEEFFNRLVLSEKEERVGKEIFKEIRNRLGFLKAVGLGYLTISRGAATLSGGEAQRIRLASAVGAGLQGVLYVLDEPSIGLHPRDNLMLLSILERLRRQGNSLIVVEHDEETMRYADYVIDVGPAAGIHGGAVTAAGSVEDLIGNPRSLTGQYLSGEKKIEIPQERKKVTAETPCLEIEGARENNLKNISVKIPLDGIFTVVTGVSGSGKSTLINRILKCELARRFHGAEEPPGEFDKITGFEHINKVIEIDQSPIGRTPRSNPATYTKIFDDIRDLFAKMPESKIRGYTKGRFSFNVAGGRCDACEGAGVISVEMQILPNVQVPCEVCGGKRFNAATLEIHYKGRTITEVLDMSIDEAILFFADIPKIAEPLLLLREIGLGYLKLGQPSTTLSGGEAQRIKIATELRRPGTGRTLYLLDEPTTGLHFEDINRLLSCLTRLRNQGNSMVIIEHNLDVIKCADYVIDLGPEAGEAGGEIVAAGTPEQIAENEKSHTGRFLKKVLNREVLTGEILASVAETDSASLDIEIAGARKHNLKNISVTIPRHEITVVSGVSGSGKSSLVFHTLFAEGQRRFVETLSTYARRFLGRMDRGSIDAIRGLAPAIAIDQGSSSRSPRSIVATLTEIYDYFRILWARAGKAHCIHCGEPIRFWTVPQIADKFWEAHKGKEFTILTPVWIQKSNRPAMVSEISNPKLISERLAEMGYRKVSLNGKLTDLPLVSIGKNISQIFAVTDHFRLGVKTKARMQEALERAYRDGNGILGVRTEDQTETFSLVPGCPVCHWYMESKPDPKNFSFNTHWGACETCYGLGTDENGEVCPDCHGERLKPEYRSVLIQNESIMSVTSKSIAQAKQWFQNCRFSGGDKLIAAPLLREISGRLDFLINVGLGYLSLSRAGDTLSGGEAQRIRLASQIGSGLEGVLYVLDEPTVGLHQSDTHKLLETLRHLKKLGNTLVMVEHDMDVIRSADHLLDLGPSAGEFGGDVVALGAPKALTRASAVKEYPQSETVKYLSGKKKLQNPENIPARPFDSFLKFKNLNAHNLKNISVQIPAKAITVVSGVSGSGKSSLVMDEIYPAVYTALSRGKKKKLSGKLIELPPSVKEVLLVDQSPISGTPRSTPASYTGVLDSIRQLFARLEVSKMKGFDVGRFSYNVARGRCSACEGRGVVSLSMHFLSDVWEVCEECKGKRYNRETLSVEFKGKNIADVLDMRLNEACTFFEGIASIVKPLRILCDVGLGYLRLGQSVTTLSGGEAQRMKLAAELSRAKASGTLYLLDEPTTGLHLADIQLLWTLLHRLVARGDTVVLIEHHPDVIRLADYRVELGPEGGDGGGFLMSEGANI